MFKVRRFERQGRVLFTLSGRIEEKQVPQLKELFEAEAEGADITLELGEITLADRETVRFLAACEARGMGLKHCPPYIREWIARQGDRNET
jgi:hypothetical protein